LRRERAPDLRLVLDNTIASPWGLRRPLLDFPGIDAIAASGTKALAGQDRDLCGYIASNRIDFLNEVMDLLAMRGGVLDWRRAAAILEGLELAEQRFERRCRSAGEVARFLVAHPRVETVHHPSLPGHPDRRVIDEHYCRSGSLLSFSLKGLDEDATRHFADVLATCIVFRYAGSFDGLSSKVNHHRTVSEYFTAEEELKRAGITRLVRLGIGIEASADLQACLNWALWHHRDLSSDVVLAWQGDREKELGLRERS
jgi:cystathionine beta-lyase/cystathionine gamma-synthase